MNSLLKPAKPRAIDRTCKSCRHFSVDKMRFPKHYEVGLGHCQFDAALGASAFRGAASTCERYDATDRRKAYLKFQGDVASA
ncbi:hypothetical protein [Collimonas humicola]|uniref:hypothetical protein n=1 Tax=Collimonas humicola TaxID=2825886 RepID=UPI001B8ACE20|nr:hypothetical protein [Collimonas humicola]